MNMEKSRFSRKVLSLSLAAALVAGAVSSTAVFAASAKPVDPADYQLADSIQGGAILHCFDWKYTDITAELPHIAQAGFTSVQTSPAQASEGTGPWYWLYQPLSFAVGTNDLGTKEELQELCDEAEKYGINVIVDVVANHLADNHENIQEDLKADKYWHTQGSSINYNDRQSITHGDLGMVDLNSEDEYVQKVVSDYVQELKGMGVDGIRWDAAKHIGLPSEGCDFWPNVLDEDMYNYGEILSKPVNGDCREEMQEYTEYMSVTDDEYGNSVLRIMRKGTIDLPELSEWVFSAIPPEKLVWWGESHDTYSNGEGSGSNGATQNEVDRAYAVVAAQGGAAPLYLSRPEATAKDSIRSGVKGSVHFTSPEIAAVNHFHNAFSDDSQYSVIPDEDDNALGIYRNGGIVIVMGTNGGGTVSMMNDVDVEENPMVPVGTYTDEITGNEFVVTKDTISGTVGESGIAVVYRSAFSNRVEADVETGTQFQGTLKVTLHTVGEVQDAAAVITAGETEKTVSFADGDVLELGSECDEGDICVTLTGKTADGKTCSAYYVYTKLKDREMPEVQPGGIVFDNTQTGWKAVSIYVYDEITTKDTITNGGWPGELMTDCGEDYFSYQLPEQFESCEHIMVIFSDGGKDQIPGAMQAGMTMAYTDKKLYDGNKWVDYPQKPEPEPEPQPEPQPEPKPEPQPEPQPEPKPEPQPEPKPEPTPVPTDDDKKSDAEDSDKHAVVPTSDSTSAFAVLALTVLSAGVIAVAMGKKKHEN